MDQQFQLEFFSFKDKLSSYLYRLTANKQDMEDILHDTYIKVTEKFHTFKGASSFKTWVFTIATNLAIDNKRVKNRWEIEVQDACKNAAMTHKHIEDLIVDTFQKQSEKIFEITEHINYCFTCIAKNLTLEKQIAIILKEMYAFKREEIATILNKSEGVVKHLLHDARNELQEKYQKRCALINKEGPCYQCGELNDFLQGYSDAKEKVEYSGLSYNKSSAENLDIRFRLINQINPLNSKGADLEDTILQILRNEIQDN